MGGGIIVGKEAIGVPGEPETGINFSCCAAGSRDEPDLSHGAETGNERIMLRVCFKKTITGAVMENCNCKERLKQHTMAEAKE